MVSWSSLVFLIIVVDDDVLFVVVDDDDDDSNIYYYYVQYLIESKHRCSAQLNEGASPRQSKS